MARLIVFSFFMVVLGSAVTTPIEPQPGVYNDQKETGEAGCAKNQYFSLFWQKCHALAGTAAVNNVCPKGTMAYTYLGDKYCNKVSGVVSPTCPKSKYFNVLLAGCDDLPGISEVNNKCQDTYIKFSYLGENRCIIVIKGDTPAGCPKGQIFETDKYRCITAPGVTAVDNKCAAADVKYTHFDGVTRCLPVPHVKH